MPDFSRRSTQPELMDRGDISFEEFADCLKQLEIINHLTLAYGPTVRWLNKASRINCSRFSLLDVGSGYGDMLRVVNKSLPNSKNWAMTGVDINPWSRKAAVEIDPDGTIDYEVADIFTFEAERKVDFTISSLFTHHLTNDELIKFIRWMDLHSVKGWLINDLHRHWLPYFFIKAATRIFSRNRLIRHDAAVSVARAFTRRDWLAILQQTGISLTGIKVTWNFPFRYVVTCQKK